MRHDNVVRVAAGTPHAQRGDIRAVLLRTLVAARAVTAARPGEDHVGLADFCVALGVRPEGNDFTHRFMAHGEGQGDVAVFQSHLLAVTQVVIAVPEVQVRVAHTAGGDLHEDFGPLGFRRLGLDELERRVRGDELIAFHDVFLRVSVAFACLCQT